VSVHLAICSRYKLVEDFDEPNEIEGHALVPLIDDTDELVRVDRIL
jgi:hypothetical protein